MNQEELKAYFKQITESTISEVDEKGLEEHKNLAPEVNADDLKKEIEDKKSEKIKMADGHKKYWKELKAEKLGESLNENYKNYQYSVDDYGTLTIYANDFDYSIAEIGGCYDMSTADIEKLADEVLEEKGLIKGNYFTAKTDEEELVKYIDEWQILYKSIEDEDEYFEEDEKGAYDRFEEVKPKVRQFIKKTYKITNNDTRNPEEEDVEVIYQDLEESVNEEIKHTEKVEPLKKLGLQIKRLSDTSIAVSKEGKSGQEIADMVSELGIEVNKINPSNVILESFKMKEATDERTIHGWNWIVTKNTKDYELLPCDVALIGMNADDPKHIELVAFCIKNDKNPKEKYFFEVFTCHPNTDNKDGFIYESSIGDWHSIKEMVECQVEWQKLENNEHVLVDAFVPPADSLINIAERIFKEDILKEPVKESYALSDKYPNHIQFENDKDSMGYPRKIYSSLEDAKRAYEFKTEGRNAAEKINFERIGKSGTTLRDLPIIIKNPLGDGYVLATVGLVTKNGLEDLEVYPVDHTNESFSKAGNLLKQFSRINEDYDASTFQFCVRTGDSLLLSKLIDEQFVKYDAAKTKEEKHEVELAVGDMLNRLCSSGTNELEEEVFNKLFDRLQGLEQRIIDDNTAEWNKEETAQRERLKTLLAKHECLNEVSNNTIKSALHKQAKKGVKTYFDSDDVDAWFDWHSKFKKNVKNYERLYADALKSKTLAEKEAFMKQYRRNEDGNYHMENLLLTAEYVGDEELIKATKALVNKYNKQGYYANGDDISRAKMELGYILDPIFDSVYDDLKQAKNESMNEVSDELVNKVAEKRKLNVQKAKDAYRKKDDEVTAEKMAVYSKYTDKEIMQNKVADEINAIDDKNVPIIKDLMQKVSDAEKKLARNQELVNIRNANKKELVTEEQEEKREVLPIKFVGVDEWNRPAFKPVDKTKKYFLTDVNNLFNEDVTEEEIKKFYADKTPLRDYITYHGYSLDDDPMGSKVKFDLEIV